MVKNDRLAFIISTYQNITTNLTLFTVNYLYMNMIVICWEKYIDI